MTENPSLVEEDDVEEKVEEEYQFTPEESERFKILVQVGSMSKTINVYGHDILISTLSVAEDLEVGLLLKEYNEPHAFQRAYKTLIAAAATKRIDGNPLIQPLSITDNTGDSVAAKFAIMKNYYPPVIDKIFTGVEDLEKNLLPVLSRLGKIYA